jgi:hypothetical protein
MFYSVGQWVGIGQWEPAEAALAQEKAGGVAFPLFDAPISEVRRA